MGKKKINIKYLLLVLFVFATISSYSQESFTKEFKWESKDSIVETILRDTSQIIKWGMNVDVPATAYKTKSLKINDLNVFILIVDICSGIYCPFIYVFIEEENQWCLKTRTHANLTEQIEIVVDSCRKKIIFTTKSKQVGELPFEVLN